VDYHNNLTLSQHFLIFWEKSRVATQLILLYILRKKGRKQEKLGNCVGNMEGIEHTYSTYSQHYLEGK